MLYVWCLRMKKGLSLPIEMVIILIIVIIVLAVVAAFFLSSGGGGIQGIGDSAALSRACNIMVSNGCTNTWKTDTNSWNTPIQGYTVNGNPGKISDACQRALSLTTNLQDKCFQYCCGVSTI